MRSTPTIVTAVTAALLLCLLPSFSQADGPLVFEDIASEPGSGLSYQRTPSASSAVLDAIKAEGTLDFEGLQGAPLKSRGAPGVALADFDLDGDLDLYVTNGPGTNNSLFSNQLQESGQLSFVDTGAINGAGAEDQDSTGVCFGDIDNDGDSDLYVLGNAEPNRLFENLGNGFFGEISAGVGGGNLTSTSCSFGDVNGDGLLDLVVANSWNWSTPLGLFVPFTFDEPNQLFLNQGANTFIDASASSGILGNAGFPPPFAGEPAVTWAISIVDLDLDGDADVLMADDQGSVPSGADGGVDRGIFHLFENDGTGHFTDKTVEKGLNVPGGWMALDFGDLNCDGRLDFFASNFSDLTALSQSGGTAPIGVFPSRWYLATEDGGYTSPDLGSLVTTPFGWGAGVFDYDADGDLDIAYHGGMDLIFFVDAANAGVLLQNQDCSATFERDVEALAGSVDHRRRNVQGLAIGDLDGNGFDDIVTVSSFDSPEPIPLLPVPGNPAAVFADAAFVPTYAPGPGPGEFTFTGITFDDGGLSVELNQGNGNRSLQVRAIGTQGRVDGSRAPRDGIGAVITVRPSGHQAPPATLRPVVGGASYASQHSLLQTFGLGSKRRAQVDILWPGGVRNRIYGARAGDMIEVHEIPCSYDDPDLDFFEYFHCVHGSLHQLRDSGEISRRTQRKRLASAIRAWFDAYSY